MIDSIGSWTNVQANIGTDALTPVRQVPGGWGPLNPGDGGGGLPSLGDGRDLGWARSWADLSTRMRSVGVDVDMLARRIGQGDGIQDVQRNMADMLKASKYLSETNVEFTMATGLLTNAATAVNKLLTQQ